MNQLFVIDGADNVATALTDTPPGPCALTGAVSGELLVTELIPRGHKAALREIPAGAPVVKHGHPVAKSLCGIAAGEWVHIHNVRSLHANA